MRLGWLTVSIASLVACVAGGCAPAPGPAPKPPAGAGDRIDVRPQIISATSEGTARELLDKGERALLAQRWREAADAFETLLAAEPSGRWTEDALYGLATAYEGLELREKARDTYADL